VEAVQSEEEIIGVGGRKEAFEKGGLLIELMSC
jgi:hypothetical protein